MSYGFYKVIHYLGIFLLVVTLGAALGRQGVTQGPDPLRKWWGAIHGTALFVVLLGGFGLLARVGVDHGAVFPGWVWVKFGVWAALGGILVLARRRGTWSMTLLAMVPFLALLAGYVAFTKPF